MTPCDLKNALATDASSAGRVAEFLGAAYVNSLGPGNLVEMGCDSIPGNPLFGKKVDFRSVDTLFQAKISPPAVLEQIADAPSETANAIKNALAAMPPGHKYQFMQFTDQYWKPSADQLNTLNEALTQAGATVHLTSSDFVYVPLR